MSECEIIILIIIISGKFHQGEREERQPYSLIAKDVLKSVSTVRGGRGRTIDSLDGRVIGGRYCLSVLSYFLFIFGGIE